MGLRLFVLFLFFPFSAFQLFLAKNFQQELIRHDYGVAGYLLNHKDAFKIAAFTAEKKQ